MLDLILHKSNELVRKEWFAEQKSSIHQGEHMRIILRDGSGNEKYRNGRLNLVDTSGEFQAIN
jgi:hypothetical protein